MERPTTNHVRGSLVEGLPLLKLAVMLTEMRLAIRTTG